jgi:uncharacterized membrane protein
MKTVDFQHSITINRPATDVWAIVADYDRDPEWRRGIVSMNPRPSGLVTTDTTALEILRFGGRTYRLPGEVVEVEPGRSFAWHAPGKARGRRTVTPIDDSSSRVELSMTVELRGMESLLSSLLVRLMHQRMDGDLARLATVAAASADSTPDPRHTSGVRAGAPVSL